MHLSLNKRERHPGASSTVDAEVGAGFKVPEQWQDPDDNATLYGKKLENRDIVTKGVRAPKSATMLLDLLNRYSAQERKN